MIQGDAHKLIDSPMFGKILVKDVYEHGRCYMQNGSEHPYKEVRAVDYCCDYTNRKKAERSGYETLDEFIERQKLDKGYY